MVSDILLENSQAAAAGGKSFAYKNLLPIIGL